MHNDPNWLCSFTSKSFELLITKRPADKSVSWLLRQASCQGMMRRGSRKQEDILSRCATAWCDVEKGKDSQLRRNRENHGNICKLWLPQIRTILLCHGLPWEKVRRQVTETGGGGADTPPPSELQSACGCENSLRMHPSCLLCSYPLSQTFAFGHCQTQGTGPDKPRAGPHMTNFVYFM